MPSFTHRLGTVITTLFVAATCAAQTLTWTGSVSTDWSTAGNWTPAGPPTTATPVVVPGSPTGGRFPSTVGVPNPACGGLTVAAGAALTLDPAASLVVNGSSSVAGTLGGAGILRLTSTAAAAFTGTYPATVDIEMETGTGPHSVGFGALVRGNLHQKAGAGALSSNGNPLQVDGLCDLEGNGLIGLGSILLHDVNFRTGVDMVSFGTITCTGTWSCNARFKPSTGDLTVFAGSGPQAITIDPTTVWGSLEVSANSTANMSGSATLETRLDCVVRGRLTTGATVVRVGRSLSISSGGQLTAASATQLLVLGGGSATRFDVAGVLNTPNANAQISGSAGTSGGASWTLNGGVHTFSAGLSIGGTLNVPTGTVFQLTGTTGAAGIGGSYPAAVDLHIEGTATQTVSARGIIRGSLFQKPGAGPVDYTGESLQVDGLCDFRGNGAIGGSLVVRDVNFLTTVDVTASGSIVCSGAWTSNAAFKPAVTDRTSFNGAAARMVSIDPGTVWGTLDIGPGGNVASPSGVTNLETRGDLIIQGHLATAATRIRAGRSMSISSGGQLDALNATLLQVGSASTHALDVAGALRTPIATAQMSGSAGTSGGGSSWSLGGGVHTINGSLAMQGSLTAPGGTLFSMLGSTGTKGLTGTFPATVDVEIVGAAAHDVGFGLWIRGNLHQKPGAGAVLHNNPMQVDGLCRFEGSSVSGSGGLTVREVVFATTNVSAVGNVSCSGNWTSNPQFQPAVGTVTMTGGNQSITTAGGCFNSLTIAGGAVVTLTNSICITNNLTVQTGGRLNNPVTATVGRNCTNSGTVDLLNLGSVEVGQNLTNTGGSYAGTGGLAAFVMTGTGNLSSSTTQLNTRLIVRAGTGRVTVVNNVPLTADFRLSSGTLGMGGSSSVFLVGGNALFEGGSLEGGPGNTGLIDVAGHVVFAGTSVVVPPLLRCAGNWTTDLAFHPNSGTVELVGTATTSIVATGNPPEARFRNLVLRNGAREPAPGLILRAATVTVEATATLRATGSGFSCIGTQFDVLGRLEILAGARLGLDPGCVLTILDPTGTLRMVGTPLSLAQLGDFQGTGFSLDIRGRVEMSNFLLEGMGPSGVRLRSSVAYAPPPDDFRAGVLRKGAATPGSVLLDVARLAPLDLRYLTFDNTPPTATFNVRSLTTAPIRMVNAGGSFAGPSFEDDPNQIIDWVSATTQLRSFTATGRLGQIGLRLVTAAEEDVRAFKVMRGPTAQGPFLDIASLPPQGGPNLGATYSTFDPNVVFPTRYFYRLEEELLHGVRSFLASDSARPLPQSVGRMAVVGSGGFADIQSAIAAVPAGGFVVVTPGTYPAFAINQPVHILGDGSGPVLIDTTAAPLQIANVPYAPGADVALYDLTVGSATSPFGVEVLNCGCPIVLDHLTVTTLATTHAVLVDQSPGVSFPPKGVALQSCTLAGGPGLRVRNGSVVYLAAGAVGQALIETSSRTTHAATTGTFTADGTSLDTPLAGTMPELQCPLLAGTEKTTTLTLRTDPVSIYVLQFTLTKDLYDLSLVAPIDMALLLNPLEFVPLATGVSLTGTVDLPLPIPAGTDLWGNGIPLQFVAVSLAMQGRWANVRDLVIVP